MELKIDSLQANKTEAALESNSKLFYSCEAQVKNKQLHDKKVTLNPLYHITWGDRWPVVKDSNLLRVQKLDYNTPIITNTLKLQIKHSLNTVISTNDNTDIKAGTNAQRP